MIAPAAWPRSPEDARLEQLARLLAGLRQSIRYVDYAQAERDCETLAAAVLCRFGRERIASARFAAIPRGGLIVLGMLSYLLDLRPEQLAPAARWPGPLFVVDDCALSGARFARFLRETDSEEIVFLQLYSPAALRRAIVARQRRVVACLAAHDLADLAAKDQRGPAERRRWHRKWLERLGPERFWVGQPEPVCFAWTEPEMPFWNEASQRVEEGWRLGPADRCLRNRARLGGLPPAAAQRRWRAPAEVVWGEFDDLLWLCQTRLGTVASLSGAGADIWRLLAAWGDAEAAAARLVETYTVAPETARGDVAAFAGQLAEAGLLERIDAPA